MQITDNKPAEELGYELKEELKMLPSGKRHAIRLNELAFYRHTYQNKSSFRTNNLLSYPVKAVAIYATEYIPEHFKEDEYITYSLTVNGKDYNVIPINSYKNGIKIIKTSEMILDSSSNIYLTEKIIDVRLNVTFTCPDRYNSASVGHLRLLVGEKDV